MTRTIVLPTEQAVQAYETAVGALRLVDAIDGGSDGNGTAVNADARAAASMALRASLAAFLVLTCPGGEQAYYVAAATEIYEEMFTQGRGVAESLGVFLSFGWQHTDGARPGHEPYTESGSTTGCSYLARGACSCGYQGRTGSPRPVVTARRKRRARGRRPTRSAMPRGRSSSRSCPCPPVEKNLAVPLDAILKGVQYRGTENGTGRTPRAPRPFSPKLHRWSAETDPGPRKEDHGRYSLAGDAGREARHPRSSRPGRAATGHRWERHYGRGSCSGSA